MPGSDFRVRLRLFSDSLQFEEVTAAIGVSPTRVARKGDVFGAAKVRRRDQDLWEYELLVYCGYGLADGMNALRSLVRGRHQEIAALARCDGNYLVLQFVVHLGEDGIPDFGLSLEDATLLVEIGANLDVDVYP